MLCTRSVYERRSAHVTARASLGMRRMPKRISERFILCYTSIPLFRWSPSTLLVYLHHYDIHLHELLLAIHKKGAGRNVRAPRERLVGNAHPPILLGLQRWERTSATETSSLRGSETASERQSPKKQEYSVNSRWCKEDLGVWNR